MGAVHPLTDFSVCVAPALKAPVKIWAAKQQEVKFEGKNSLVWSECHRIFLVKYILELISVVALLVGLYIPYLCSACVLVFHFNHTTLYFDRLFISHLNGWSSIRG